MRLKHLVRSWGGALCAASLAVVLAPAPCLASTLVESDGTTGDDVALVVESPEIATLEGAPVESEQRLVASSPFSDATGDSLASEGEPGSLEEPPVSEGSDGAPSEGVVGVDGSEPDAEEGALVEGADGAAVDQPGQGDVEDAVDEGATSDIETMSPDLNGWVVVDGVTYWYQNGQAVTGWVVTDVAPGSTVVTGLQRYWLDSEGRLVTSGLIEAEDGWTSYATSTGAVVRGKWTDPASGYVYLADNDGRLEQSGWLVTDEYDGGLQRYWVDAIARAAIPGVSSDGWDHFTTVAGYVARGKYWNSTDTLYLADNDGRLALGDASGWLVTSDFDGAFQRYWVNPETGAASTGSFVVADEHYYSLPELGYVLRGKLAYGAGMLLADNDGVLAWDEGWLVSDAYDGEMQRYRIDGAPGDGLMGVHLGFFTLEGNDYYSREDVGYTARNDWYFIVAKGSWYHADNDAVLTILVGKKVGYQNPAGYPQVGAYTVTLPGYCTGYYTYVMPCQLRPDATRSDCVETFISAAMRYLGTTWVDNCCSRPGDTIDCTGLVLEGLYACGVSLDGLPSGDYNPYTKRYQNHHFANSWRLNQVFMPVSVGSIQRGDILYFEGHVAIYLGGGKILDSYPGTNTSVHSYYSSMYGGVLGAARLFV